MKDSLKNNNKLLLDNFTKREAQVFKLVLKEMTNKEIADKLDISYRTVDCHRRKLLLKTNSKNVVELMKYSFKNKLITY